MKSKSAVFVGLIVMIGYFSMSIFLMLHTVDFTSAQGAIVAGLVEFTKALAAGVVGYYFGSSEGSQNKDEFKFKVQDGYRKAQEAKEAADHWRRNFGADGVHKADDGDS